MRRKLSTFERVMGVQTRKALSDISRGNGGTYRSPPTSLQIEGTNTSDRQEWNMALRELAQRKFVTDEIHAKEMQQLLAKLRSVAQAARLDGHSVGEPSFNDFLDELARLRGVAASGQDLVPGIFWQQSPHTG